MSRRKLNEWQVLKKLDAHDFRRLSKGKMVRFAFMIPNMSPKQSRKLLSSLTDFTKTILEANNLADTEVLQYMV